MPQNLGSLGDWTQPSLLEKDDTALVVMSGGQDSTTCLGVALSRHAKVQAISFDYGQKHAVELEYAQKICDKKGVPLTVVNVPALQLMKSSALVNHGDTNKEHEYLKGLPASFVPARNALFLTMAWGLAMEIGAKHIYTGVCQTDYSGYPDCRDEFIMRLNRALEIGYETKIEIKTPLMHLDKGDTFELARRVGILPEVMELSHTCYNGGRDLHDFGRGCGDCPACNLRKKGFGVYVERYAGFIPVPEEKQVETKTKSKKKG